MEASERPQLEFAEAGVEPARRRRADAAGTVRAIGDRLVIESLTVNDERAAGVVRERAELGEDPADTVATAIEIGARVMEREGAELDLEHARHEFERSAEKAVAAWDERSKAAVEAVNKELERVFSGEGGLLSRTLDGFGDELADEVSKHFDGERATAVQNQVKELVGKTLEERFHLFARQFFDDEKGPLGTYTANIRHHLSEAFKSQREQSAQLNAGVEAIKIELARLTEQAEAKVRIAEAEEAGTRKGRAFEERVHDALEQIAAGIGDVAHHTGDVADASGSKKGDTVVEISASDGPCQGRIVFEAKDKQLSKPKAWAELNEAMKVREAEYAVLVVAGEEHIPAGREELQEYEGNKLIVSVDAEDPCENALRLAYRYARLRVLLSRNRSLEVDASGVLDAAESARNILKRASTVRRHFTGIKSSTDAAREGFEAIVEEADAELARIESLVATAADAD